MDATKKLILKYAVRPVSTRALQAQLKLDESTVRYHIRTLRDAGMLHIAEWLKGRTQPTPLYKVGNAQDAEKPAPYSKAELHRRSRSHNPHVTFYRKATPWDALLRKRYERSC